MQSNKVSSSLPLEDYCIQLKQGNYAAADRLLEASNAFIWKQVHDLVRMYGILARDEEDLYQESCITFLKAAQRYDASMGIPFLPYAKQAIRNCLIDQLRTAIRNDHCSLNDVVSDDSDAEWLDLVEDTSSQQTLDQKEQKLSLHAAMQALSSREQSYIQYRFGFDDGKEHALDDARLHFGLSVSRAQKLENTAIKKLRKELSA